MREKKRVHAHSTKKKKMKSKVNEQGARKNENN